MATPGDVEAARAPAAVEVHAGPAATAPIAQDGKPVYELAVQLLHGTSANHLLCCGSMITSAAFTVAGYFVMAQGDTCARFAPLVSLLFVVSQAFTVTKTSRDRTVALATRAGIEAAGAFAAELGLLLPTPAYMVQVLLFFLLAVSSAVFMLFQMDISPEWRCFFLISLLWTLVCALCVSKSVRDRAEAATWAQVPSVYHDERLEYVLSTCGGTLEYQALVWAAFPLALGSSLLWIWLGDADLAIERKGFLSIGLLFNVTSCLHAAKLVRDRSQVVEAQKLRKQLPFQIMVVLSFVLSFVVPLIAICMMNLKTQHFFFLLVGQLMCTNTALNLAKLVRDRLEVQHLRATQQE